MGQTLQDYICTLKHMFGVENKVAIAQSLNCLLNQMSAEVVCFDKIKEEYALCPNFGEIVILLKEDATLEIDGLLLQDKYLF